jgi:hypothetical protein
MSTPLLNFVGAVGFGVVIGVLGALVLRGKRPNAMWMAPTLAIAGSLIASVIALFAGDRRDFGPKEMALQAVLALAGVALAYFVGASKDAGKAVTGASAE